MKLKNDKIIIQITCLIVSVALWMFVMVVTNPPINSNYTNIPITIKNLSALENSNLVLMNSDKDSLTVNVTVKGTREQIAKYSKSDFNASIDVLGLTEGITNAKVEISGPSGLEITNVSPSQIPCKVEGIVSKIMDVSVQYEGSQTDTYHRVSPALRPSSVKITGPRSVVDSAAIAVATVNIEGAVDNVTKTVPVRVYDGKDTEIFMSTPVDNVEVTVPIYPTKYVKLVPNVIGIPEDGYQLTNVTVKPDKVRIAAKKEVLNTITELMVEDLDISGAYNNILSSREILNTEGLIMLDLDRDPVVNALVEKIVEREFVFNSSDVNFTNLAEGNEAKVESEELEIIALVSGPASIVNSLRKDDLTLTADLSQATEGLNNVQIVCTTENNVNSIALTQETINVQINKANVSPEE